MARLEALLLCDLIVKGPDGKVQIQGIFDRISAAKFPAQHRAMWAYFRFFVDEKERGDTENHMLSFMVRRPNGANKALPSVHIQVKGPPGEAKVEGQIQMQGLPIHEKGEHWFDLYFDDKRIGSYKFSGTLLPSAKRTTKKGRGHESVH